MAAQAVVALAAALAMDSLEAQRAQVEVLRVAAPRVASQAAHEVAAERAEGPQEADQEEAKMVGTTAESTEVLCSTPCSACWRYWGKGAW